MKKVQNLKKRKRSPPPLSEGRLRACSQACYSVRRCDQQQRIVCTLQHRRTLLTLQSVTQTHSRDSQRNTAVRRRQHSPWCVRDRQRYPRVTSIDMTHTNARHSAQVTNTTFLCVGFLSSTTTLRPLHDTEL